MDASANLIGIVTAKLDALKVMVATNGNIPENVNFAIKASVAANFLESNEVAYASGVAGPAIPPTDLASKAKALSVRVNYR